MSDNVIMSVAIGTFIADVHQRLPPYWYSLTGEGMGSLACLFGTNEANMCSLLLKAKILFWYKEKDKEPEMRFKKKTFDDALLLIPSYTEGIEAEVSKLKDPSIKCLRSNKAAPPKKKQWFIRILGCSYHGGNGTSDSGSVAGGGTSRAHVSKRTCWMYCRRMNLF